VVGGGDCGAGVVGVGVGVGVTGVGAGLGLGVDTPGDEIRIAGGRPAGRATVRVTTRAAGRFG
jgi:hypothetical protein